jgi:RimK family alpha-L-glutamate ligase
MTVTILSSGTGWHVQDLLRAAKLLPVEMQWMGFPQLCAAIQGNREVLVTDPILVRTMAAGSLEQIIFRMDVLHRCAANGTVVMNPPKALETCIDKYLCTARLAAAGLPVPDTEVCQDANAAMESFHRLGSNVVIKPLFGSEGRGIVHVTDEDTCWRVCHTLENLGAVIYLQRFVPHDGFDLRLFVLGKRVLASMRRWKAQDWRTNIAQGGVGEAYQPSKEEETLALQAAAAVGAEYAGVDLLPGRDGRLYILEVNGVPGWRTLSSVTGVDVAAEVLRYLSFPRRGCVI